MVSTRPRWVYCGGLLFVVVFWGVSSVLYTYFYRYFSAAVLTGIMTFFSAIFFWILAGKRLKNMNRKFLKVVIPICAINAFANVLNRIGLQYTTPANYAFFENVSCIVVPVMMFVFIRKKPTRIQVIAGITCLAGCFIMCGVSVTGSSVIGIGDGLCLLSGVLIGVCVAAIGAYTKDMDVTLFMVVYMTAYFLVSVLLAVGLDIAAIESAKITGGWPMMLLAALFGLVDVALCWLLRTEAIQHIDPVTVATVSPCYAVITGVISVCVGIDKLNTNLVLGGSIIFLSAVIPELMDALARRKNQEVNHGE